MSAGRVVAKNPLVISNGELVKLGIASDFFSRSGGNLQQQSQLVMLAGGKASSDKKSQRKVDLQQH